MFDGNHRSRRQVNLGGTGSNKGGGGGSRRRGRTSTRPGLGTSAQDRNSVGSLPAFTAAAETGRESLLEQTRLLREERRRFQLEENSATKIQKVYRGWQGRKVVARDQLEALWQERRLTHHGQQQPQGGQPPSWMAQESFLLSLRLSPPLLQATQRSSPSDLSMMVDSWLLEHAATIRQFTTQQHQNSQSPHYHHHVATAPYALSFRIVQAALSRLRPLHCSDPTTEEHFNALFDILEYYLKGASLLWKRIGGAQGLLVLLQATQECLWWQAGNTTCTTSSHPQQQQKCLMKWSCQAVDELELDSPLQQAGQALLAAIVMGHHTGITKDPLCSWWCHYGNNSDLTTEPSILYESYFSSLVQHVLNTAKPPPPTENTVSDKYVVLFSKVLTRVLQGRWHIVLANALDWQHATRQSTLTATKGLPSTSLLRFLHHILTHHNDLAILTSMVVRGDDVRSLVLLQQKQHARTVGDDDEDNDRLLEEEMEEQTAPFAEAAPVLVSADSTSTGRDNTNTGTTTSQSTNKSSAVSSKKHKSSASRKLSKQELQTMPQLDRIYQEEIQRQMNQTVSALLDKTSSNNCTSRAYAQSLVEMAIQIGNPSLWISWGNMLLVQSPTTTSAATAEMDTSTSDDSTASRHVFVQMLALVLQSATGLRSRNSASSPFLSQLAFAGGGKMIEQLWLTARLRADIDSASSHDAFTCTILTVFCDVFAHSLIALSDEKFLQLYTNVGSDVRGAAPRNVMAEQVIGCLRNLLHEVYWTKPIVVDDVRLAAACSTTENLSEEEFLRKTRARFLLSGTKLWGSLYERWCRLVRSIPFCHESTWWFPHLASQEGDNAVVNASAQRQGSESGDPNGVAPMDIDDSDDDDDDGDHRMDQRPSGGDGTQPPAIAVADAENDALASSFRDPKMARVLTCIPQALPFDRRVRLFDSLLSADKLKTQDENAEFRMAMVMMMRGEENPMGSGRERVDIRRDHLYEDSMQQLNQLGSRLKKKVQVAFINQHGTQEAGIDGGGVFKEFVDDLIKDAFSIETKSNDERASEIPRLFTVTPLQTLTVNSSLKQDNNMLSHYEFLGRVLGKAVYESILVEPQFCLPFLNQLLGKRNSLEDLKNFDMEYYKNLTKLLALNEKEIEDLSLTFELSIGKGPSLRTVELLPGGRSKQVCKQNVIQYVHLVAHQRLNVQGAIQTRSFLNGFRDLIPASWVRLFSAYELQKLISGDDSLRGFDVESLKRAMKYAAGYHPSQPIMQWFWEVIEEFTPEQQRKFLKFMTSCSRQPLLGFSSLEPPPCVQQIRLPDDMFSGDDLSSIVKNAPLPTSSTCMNLLKLPNYRNKALLRKKLLDAVESGAGFELT